MPPSEHSGQDLRASSLEHAEGRPASTTTDVFVPELHAATMANATQARRRADIGYSFPSVASRGVASRSVQSAMHESARLVPLGHVQPLGPQTEEATFCSHE